VLTGTAQDFEDGSLSGDRLVWTSSLDGHLGTGSYIITGPEPEDPPDPSPYTGRPLTPGEHTITLTATDNGGGVGRFEITITVSNNPPTVLITGPAEGSVWNSGQIITFQGSGSDPEDGPLPLSSLIWTTETGIAIGNGSPRPYDALPVGTHTIILRGIDSKGVIGQASITIRVQ